MAATEDDIYTPVAADSAGEFAWPLLRKAVPQIIAAGGTAAAYREVLAAAQADLRSKFLAEEPLEALVRARAALIDELLRELWRTRVATHAAAWTLVAVGGYGRGELHPCSDVDILILVPAALDAAGREALEPLVTFLWDIGLEVGQSVRTVAQCAEESIADVSVMTTLIEARLIAGNTQLLDEMRTALASAEVWPIRSFFDAKIKEQQERHVKANDTAYNLEPNVKTGPGGLRDIQTIGWVAKRHFGVETFEALAALGDRKSVV